MSNLLAAASFILGGFTSPEPIGVTPDSILWLLPLVAAIAVGYKVNKLPEIRAANFIRESVVLFVSIVVFMGLTGLGLSVVAWLVAG